MANRSNRRQSNPGIAEYTKYVEAIGNRRANNPLWPGINVCQLERPDIRMQSCHVCQNRLLAMRRSPYTDVSGPSDRIWHVANKQNPAHQFFSLSPTRIACFQDCKDSEELLLEISSTNSTKSGATMRRPSCCHQC